MIETLKAHKKYLFHGIFIVAIILICLAFNCCCDGKSDDETENIISVSGHGEVYAVPDIANIYFTINKEAKTVKDAQAGVAEIEKKAMEVLRANKVAEKDIKTQNVSFNPKYEYKYETQVMPCSGYNCPPIPGKNVIVGYEAYESITVKIRNTDNVGKIIQELGITGISDLNGPNFAIDDEDELKMEARKEAIKEAKNKARILAKDLGVRLGKITSFSENGNYPAPMYDRMMMGSAKAESAPAEIPKGENLITSDVTITYEIK